MYFDTRVDKHMYTYPPVGWASLPSDKDKIIELQAKIIQLLNENKELKEELGLLKKKKHSQQIKTGLAVAKAKGKGPGRPKITLATETEILRARLDGKGMIAIAKEVGVGVGTVQRVLKKVSK